jgi:methionyl-tRNA formyltransferase
LSNASSPLRLGFAGTPEFAVPALSRLAATHHSVEVVFTQPDRPAGRGQALQASAVKKKALELGIRVLQPASFKSAEAIESLRAAQLDVFVVVAYGQILPSTALGVPTHGCLNIHGSLLPRWRGAAPIQRAILAGDCQTGVTIMRMEAGLDTGPMLLARTVDIGLRDNAQTVHDKLAQLGAELIVEAVQSIAAGNLREVRQPADGVTYAEKVSKAEAPIDWHHAAGQISRQVRAFNPWPVAQTQFNGEALRIWDADSVDLHFAGAGRDVAPGTVMAATGEGIDVACGTGVLRILRLQLPGRKPLTAQEFLQGQRLTGAVFVSA